MAFYRFSPYDDEENYLFDNTKIEITGGLGKLLATVVPGTAYMYAKFDENQGLVAIDSTGNGRHGAFQGGWDENRWTTGKINYAVNGISTTGGFANFDQQIAFERTDAFSLECWLKTSSTATMALISKQLNSTPFTGFAINMLLGKVRVVIRDSANVISKEHNIAIDDNIFHHIVFTYDGSSTPAGVKLYVDNTINSSDIATDTLTSTILTTANFQVSGRDGNNNTIDNNTTIDEVVVYDREINASEVAFRWNGGAGTQVLPGAGTSFPTDNPTCPPRTSIAVSEIISVAATVNVSGNDEVRFNPEINSVRYFWNGSIWGVSSDYSETNTIAEINANINDLNNLISIGSGFNLIPYLHSDDGSTTPEILDIRVDYNVAGQPDDIFRCTVWGKNVDAEGNPDTTPFVIQLSEDAIQYLSETVVRDNKFTITPDSNGDWEQDLIETVNMPPSVFYEFRFSGIAIVRKDVPRELRKNIWALPDP